MAQQIALVQLVPPIAEGLGPSTVFSLPLMPIALRLQLMLLMLASNRLGQLFEHQLGLLLYGLAQFLRIDLAPCFGAGLARHMILRLTQPNQDCATSQ